MSEFNMKLSKMTKKLTALEKWYSTAFFMFIVAGIGYGIVDREYYLCCEDFVGVPEEGTSPMEIFSNNYFLGIAEMLTAGLFSLYLNFHTFAVSSSYLYANGQLIALPIIFLIGILELAGSLLLGLVGISFVERKLLKIKSKLDWKHLFFIGTVFIFLGAIIEYFLISI